MHRSNSLQVTLDKSAWQMCICKCVMQHKNMQHANAKHIEIRGAQVAVYVKYFGHPSISVRVFPHMTLDGEAAQHPSFCHMKDVSP